MIRVNADARNGSVYGIPSDYDPDVTLDIGFGESGDCWVTLTNRETNQRVEFQLAGNSGGSQNKKLVPIFLDFIKKLAEQVKVQS